MIRFSKSNKERKLRDKERFERSYEVSIEFSNLMPAQWRSCWTIYQTRFPLQGYLAHKKTPTPLGLGPP